MYLIDRNRWMLARAGARGLVAAMAMTGVRTVTANVGLVGRSPPQAIAERHAPWRLHRLARGHRTALIELAHWSYGTFGGVVFALLPPRMRSHPWTGPLYGLSVWLAFELGLAPLLNVEHTRKRGVLSRAVLAADHALYGVVVAGRLAPQSGEDHVSGRARRKPADDRGKRKHADYGHLA